MSRIIANNIRHNDATADSLSLDSSGNVTAPNNLSTSGNLGVGTTNPSTDLHINTGVTRELRMDGTGSSRIRLISGSTDNGNSVFVSTGDFAVSGGSATDLGLGTQSSNILMTRGGGVVARFTGDGLTFGNDTAATNALDDYEEGTFSPTLGGGSNTFTQTATGIYTKIGRAVTCMMRCQWSARSGSDGVTVALPFPVNSTSTLRGAGSIGMLSGVADFIYTSSLLYFQVDPSASFGNLRFSNENSTWSAFTPAQMQAGGEFQLSITYQI